MQARSQRQQRQILTRRRHQRHAPGHVRHGSAHEAGGHGHRGQIEQVDKIGVMAQVGVEPDRVGLHRRNGVGRAGGRGDQAVNAVPNGQRLLLQFFQAVQRGKGVRGGYLDALLGDDARHRVQRFRLGLDKVPDGLVTLGHPRAFIEQGRHRAKRPQVHGHRRATQGGQVRHRPGKLGRTFRVAMKLQVFHARHTKAKRAGGAEVVAMRGQGARIGVQRVRALRGREHRGRVTRRERKHRHHVQRAAGRHHAGGGKPAAGRFQAHQIVQHGRHTARTCGVGAERETGQTPRHRHGRPGR